ncbi:hypothetical protein KKF64_02075 [Patescibacteria group bacterium]|nr:hypothetical protein [Patescibacteria group bacterium]
MAIDIRKGSTPFTRIYKPNEEQNQSHIKRYFAKNIYAIIRMLSLVAVFLMPVWIFGFDAGAFSIESFWLDRSVLLVLASSIIFSLWFLYSIIFVGQFLYIRFSVNTGLLLLLASAALCAIFGYDAIRSIGLRSFDASVSAPLIIFGILWILFLVNFPYHRALSLKRIETDKEELGAQIDADAGFPKMMLVAHLLGSALLVLYVIVFYFLSDEKSSLSWVYSNSWLVVFAVNVFLLTGFAMLQRGIAKAVWSFAIASHLFALFLWDSTDVWIVTIAGISALLIFQIIYSKNLWQKNFTYPLQIWVLSVLLLFLPIKMFTGAVYETQELFVPQNNILNSGISTRQKIFGVGPSNSFIKIFKENIEASDSRKDDSFILSRHIPIAAVRAIHIEYGLFGVFAFTIFVLIFFIHGIKFLKDNIQAYKTRALPDSGSTGMSESAYLGVIVFCAFIMVCISVLFAAWSLIIWWILAFLAGIFTCLQSIGAEKAFRKINCGKTGNLYVSSIVFLAVFLTACISYSYFYIQTARSQSFARAAMRAEDEIQSFDLWEKASRTNPRDNMFLANTAQAELNLLSAETPLNVQRDILERSTQRLSYVINMAHDPFALWATADAYISLEKYAEGSVQLARKTYLNILDQMPFYLYIPVALSQFYQEYDSSLVSDEISVAFLKSEARSYLERALKIEPSYLPARLELSFIIEQEDGIAAAIAELEPWEEKSPEIMYHVGRLYFNDANFSQASEKFIQVVREVPNHSNARYSLGITYFRLEQYSDSLYEFEELLRLNPGNKDVQEKIAQVKEKLGVADDE